jgi:hypothetical protein
MVAHTGFLIFAHPVILLDEGGINMGFETLEGYMEDLL